ncbi:MAG TPA: hypothetical protein VGO62_19550, partial [Myxococcota bacterium]
MPFDIALVKRVLDKRLQALSLEERRRMGALWCDRAIRVHLASALGDAGSLTASSLARTAGAVDAGHTAPTQALLARISSADPTSERV